MVKLVLVSHEASRTGAPRVAVEIARAVHAAQIDPVVIVRWDGPLAEDFRASGARVVLEPLRRTRVALRAHRRLRSAAVQLEVAVARAMLRRHQPEVLYLNTVKSACYVRPALELGIRTILHVHETGPLLVDTLARYRLQDVYDRLELVACSEAVRRDLARTTGIPEVTIEVLLSVPDEDRVRALAARPWRHGRDGRLLVVACATADHRKGVDLWLRMARAVIDRRDDVDFVWVGRPPEGEMARLVENLELGDRVRFSGSLDNPYPEIAAADVFTLSSREDPFPLAVTEAMHLGRPIVAFDVGGVREQLDDAGVLVPAGDWESMARQVDHLLGDPARRDELSMRATSRAGHEFGIETFQRRVASTIGRS
jgi:glycosyltransferase involved in cell wall biosynthesis